MPSVSPFTASQNIIENGDFAPGEAVRARLPKPLWLLLPQSLPAPDTVKYTAKKDARRITIQCSLNAAAVALKRRSLSLD